MDKAKLANVLAVISTILFIGSICLNPIGTFHAVAYVLGAVAFVSLVGLLYTIFLCTIRAMMGMDR